MSHDYVPVSWTPFKKRFDAWLFVGMALYLGAFVLVTDFAQPANENFTPIQLMIRATGSLAFLMLTFILCIGPLARMTPRFKPFLYNRRHLGVSTFLIALVHGGLVLLWYHGFAELDPLVSLFVSNPRYDSLAGFPFESLGFCALLILFLMAATSHDFWNANLAPGLWKAIHMGVYLAYGLLVAHVLLGALQFEKHPLYASLLVLGSTFVVGLHLFTAFFASSTQVRASASARWIKVGRISDIPDNRALVVQPANAERIAVFRYDDKISAVSNVCRHQGGPLGEGKVIDGCITCPWHGFQYRPEDGCSPEPFTEKIHTYSTKIEGNLVYVARKPNPEGTKTSPSLIRKEPV